MAQQFKLQVATFTIFGDFTPCDPQGPVPGPSHVTGEIREELYDFAAKTVLPMETNPAAYRWLNSLEKAIVHFNLIFTLSAS
jgi:hypothetical protein